MEKFELIKKDMLLVNKIFGKFDAESLPASFKLGEKEYRGIGEEFSPTLRIKEVDSNITETIIEGKKVSHADNRLQHQRNDYRRQKLRRGLRPCRNHRV